MSRGSTTNKQTAEANNTPELSPLCSPSGDFCAAGPPAAIPPVRCPFVRGTTCHFICQVLMAPAPLVAYFRPKRHLFMGASHSHMTDGPSGSASCLFTSQLRVLIVCARKWAELAFVHLVGGQPSNGLLALILICRWCCSWCLSCRGCQPGEFAQIINLLKAFHHISIPFVE